MNKFLILIIMICGFAILFGVGRAWKLQPETPANHMLHKGEVAVLTSTTGKAIWLTASKQDTHALQVAMGRQDQEALDRAEAARTAFPAVAGTRARIVTQDVSRFQVEILEGPGAGKLGWVEFEYLRPMRPSENR